jgi:hypothetical protein
MCVTPISQGQGGCLPDENGDVSKDSAIKEEGAHAHIVLVVVLESDLQTEQSDEEKQ